MIQGNLDENDVVEISSDKVPMEINEPLPTIPMTLRPKSLRSPGTRQ